MARRVPIADVRAVERIALDEMLQITCPTAERPLARVSRLGARVLLTPAAASLARTLAALDRAIARDSLRGGALAGLRRYGVQARVTGPGLRPSPVASATLPIPARGPLLILSNHPGLFDALALFAAAAREDLAVVAARRPLLDALPNVRAHLLAVEPNASAYSSVRAAVRHLVSGGAVLHFPAGRIEPDPRLARGDAPTLGAWQPGARAIVAATTRKRPDLCVVPVLVSGVVSRRARAVAGALGRGDMTDALVPLLQLTLPGFRDVDVLVRSGKLLWAGPGHDGALEVLDRARESLVEMARERAGEGSAVAGSRRGGLREQPPAGWGGPA